MKKPRYRITFWKHRDKPNFNDLDRIGTWVPFDGKWVIIRLVKPQRCLPIATASKHIITGFNITDTEGNSLLPDWFEKKAMLTIHDKQGNELATGKIDGEGNLQWQPEGFSLPPDTNIKVEIVLSGGVNFSTS